MAHIFWTETQFILDQFSTTFEVVSFLWTGGDVVYKDSWEDEFLSDYNLLRGCNIPALLSEASFFGLSGLEAALQVAHFFAKIIQP